MVDRARIDRFPEGIVRTSDGGGPLDLLLGEPSAGKTALLAATTARAEHRGMHVVATAGAEDQAHLSDGGLGAAACRPGRSPFPRLWATETARRPTTDRWPATSCRWSPGSPATGRR
ncbi:hypothetical protein ACFVRB_39015 [Streptomyces nojiriensis]|uniref:hypothetical protein n=1 Tax=Streptomyces nojiriensis TaxID=66374 RepID=UPI0036DEA8ED